MTVLSIILGCRHILARRLGIRLPHQLERNCKVIAAYRQIPVLRIREAPCHGDLHLWRHRPSHSRQRFAPL